MADSAQEFEGDIAPLAAFSSISQLKQEIEKLEAKQDGTRRRAIYGGLTPQEEKEYGNRRAQLSQLQKRLIQLETEGKGK
jgi:predicted RNase H-like nuclease (RuvC/YqgF family)